MKKLMTNKEMEKARGLDLLGAKRWSEQDKLDAFMAIFHPGREGKRVVIEK